MNNKEKMKYILTLMEKKYGHPKVFLNYTTEYQLMVAVILSAQCTDKRVNIITKEFMTYLYLV